MNKKHTLLMLACCLIPLIAIGAVSIFRIPFSQVLIFAMILLCPISMFFMMRGMMKGEDHDRAHQPNQPHVHDKAVNSPWTNKDIKT